GLGFLIFFHELGHFTAARSFGVKVEAFSIGMGPILLHKNIKGTDYRLSLIPLGGYCSMKGEHDYQTAIEKKLSSIQGERDSFYGVHPLKRLIIAFAGPFFNLIFGFLAFTIIALMGYTYYTAGTTVSMADEVYEGMPSPAHDAGMKTGDTITSIDGIQMQDFSEIAEYIAINPDKDITITVTRDDGTHEIKLHTLLDTETGSGKIGIVSSPDSVLERHYGPYGFLTALREGCTECLKLGRLTIKGISLLFKGVKITSAVSGPARITTMLGDTVKQGFAESIHIGIVSTLQLLAIISLSLFITNLLPVPILDGGLILFAFIECISKKKINPKLLYYIQFIGIAFIGFLMAIAIMGDITYFFSK
ncbi:MAG: site-2 protease family protein, partial [Treponema sp.]|nr:site-2 protease family protein [Treponema sp.]